ncbi:unnamed protein product [Spirodela intermedia]|uniref:Uncharacterized protein n=1 Tax=Spirodela intermedia TaxID=51605 RepID=A0A7I8KLG5_SPIIN|nr:unnamed protein product [Spirodela intermedia]
MRRRYTEILSSFILRSAQQEEALHRIWYALKRFKASRLPLRGGPFLLFL